MSDGPLGRALVDLTGLGWRLARSRLEGLSDEELFWEPVAGCWSVRPRSEVVGVAPDENPGGWWIDGDGIEAPEPPPFTTIAWLIAHMVLATWNYNDRIAGHSVTPEPALVPSARDAVAQWEEVMSRFESWSRASPMRTWHGGRRLGRSGSPVLHYPTRGHRGSSPRRRGRPTPRPLPQPAELGGWMMVRSR